MSLLHYLIARGNDFLALRELLKRGEDPNAVDARGNTALHIAVFKKAGDSQEFETYLEAVRRLIHRGANVNRQNNIGYTALHIAVARRNYKMMALLLNCNAEIDTRDTFGNTALHYAIDRKQVLQRATSIPDNSTGPSLPALKAVKLLMEYGPDINLYNQSHETPLLWAVQQQNLQIVKILLERGASLSLRDLHGNDVLHHALDQTEVNAKIVAELLRHGSSHDSSNHQSATPVDVYLNRLYRASSYERAKAKVLFKLFVFQQNNFKISHFRDIAIISRKMQSSLCQFFWYCRYEIEQMKSDELLENCTVYNLASWGFYSRRSAYKALLPKIFDVAIDKLKNGEYTVYSDMILSGVSKQYLATKTAETGYWTNKRGERKEFLIFDMRYFLCDYLTNCEVFNLMLAFSSSRSFSKTCKFCDVL